MVSTLRAGGAAIFPWRARRLRRECGALPLPSDRITEMPADAPAAPLPSGTPPDTLDEMRALLRQLPGPDLEAGTAAALPGSQSTRPAGALGRLEALAAWFATWQGKHPPVLRRPRTAVFAANHGVAARGVSAYPAAVTAQMVANFVAG